MKTSAGTLTKIKAGGSGYISQNDPRLLFGLGHDAAAQSVEVTWPNGKVEQFAVGSTTGVPHPSSSEEGAPQGALKANSTYVLRYGTGQATPIQLASAKLPDPLTKSQTLARGLKFKIGQPFPTVQVQLLSGKKANLSSIIRPGHRTIVNLWATWCVPCRKEMPELNRIRPALAKNGVDLIGLNVDVEQDGRVQTFLKKLPVDYPIYLGGVPAISELFATDELTIPLSVIIGPDGRVEDLISGWSANTQRKLQSLTGGAK